MSKHRSEECRKSVLNRVATVDCVKFSTRFVRRNTSAEGAQMSRESWKHFSHRNGNRRGNTQARLMTSKGSSWHRYT